MPGISSDDSLLPALQTMYHPCPCIGSVLKALLGKQGGPHSTPTTLPSPSPWVPQFLPKSQSFPSPLGPCFPQNPKESGFLQASPTQKQESYCWDCPKMCQSPRRNLQQTPRQGTQPWRHLQVSPSRFWCFRGLNTLCCIPSFFSGKPAFINSSKSGRGQICSLPNHL